VGLPGGRCRAPHSTPYTARTTLPCIKHRRVNYTSVFEAHNRVETCLTYWAAFTIAAPTLPKSLQSLKSVLEAKSKGCVRPTQIKDLAFGGTATARNSSQWHDKRTKPQPATQDIFARTVRAATLQPTWCQTTYSEFENDEPAPYKIADEVFVNEHDKTANKAAAQFFKDQIRKRQKSAADSVFVNPDRMNQKEYIRETFKDFLMSREWKQLNMRTRMKKYHEEKPDGSPGWVWRLKEDSGAPLWMDRVSTRSGRTAQ
jgi:hypothetical protein